LILTSKWYFLQLSPELALAELEAFLELEDSLTQPPASTSTEEVPNYKGIGSVSYWTHLLFPIYLPYLGLYITQYSNWSYYVANVATLYPQICYRYNLCCSSCSISCMVSDLHIHFLYSGCYWVWSVHAAPGCLKPMPSKVCGYIQTLRGRFYY
jgi:hypothetical protein